MKDFLTLFKTIIDLKGLTFLVLKPLMIKKLRLVFFLAMVIKLFDLFYAPLSMVPNLCSVQPPPSYSIDIEFVQVGFLPIAFQMINDVKGGGWRLRFCIMPSSQVFGRCLLTSNGTRNQ